MYLKFIIAEAICIQDLKFFDNTSNRTSSRLYVTSQAKIQSILNRKGKIFSLI
jgi:hypothetical protein